VRAVRISGSGVEVVEVPAPAGPGVRVRVRSAGICGSDLHLIAGPFRIPHTLGHEIAGVTDDGTPVAIEPLAPCGACDLCAQGDYHLCRLGPGIVIGIGRDGGMADEIRVPERALVRLPSGVAPTDACLVEPLAVAIHGLRRAGLRGGERVAVVGGGSIGLLALAAARAAGAEVGLVARHDAQRAAGERLGAREAAGEYPLVIECAGSRGALERAVELARPAATLLLLATYWQGLELPSIAVTLREVTIVPASLYSRGPAGRDVDAAAALLAANPEIPRALVSHRFPLDAAPEAFATAADRAAGSIKVVLEP
jgi:threonine dehydrogenase-like Zn-dependent dehydrogenase